MTEDSAHEEQAGTSQSSTNQSSTSDSETTQSASRTEHSSSDIEIDSFLGPEHHPCNPSLLMYLLVGDNIDKTMKPRNMTGEHQTRSLHYFHVYALRDRIDLSDFSSEVPTPDISKMNMEDLLPSTDDHLMLHENMAILMGRILHKYMPFIKKFGTGLGRHIFHEHYEDLSTKSEVVSCATVYIW